MEIRPTKPSVTVGWTPNRDGWIVELAQHGAYGVKTRYVAYSTLEPEPRIFKQLDKAIEFIEANSFKTA